MRYKVPSAILSHTFDYLRRCGRGRRECQALWISAWQAPERITEVIHPVHVAYAQGFSLDSSWLNAFWIHLAEMDKGIRAQVHTHPTSAFHSATDDECPIIQTPGFLSLVIPNFAMGPIGLEDAYLTEITPNGTWREVRFEERLDII